MPGQEVAVMLSENRVSRQIEEYIQYKRSIGFQLKIESQELRRFARYTREIDHEGPLTVDVAMAWSTQKESYSRWYMSRRLETIHTFAVYAAAVDHEAQIPQTGVFGKCHGRVTPYIYSEPEILKLMKEAENLFSTDGIRPASVSTALGLLYSTGLRVSELTTLKCGDVDSINGVIHIRDTKFKKERLVPLNESVVSELISYDSFIISKTGTRSDDSYYFQTTGGRHLTTNKLEYAFKLIRKVLLGEAKTTWYRRNPRLYDIRHTFACNTIKRWTEDGKDVNQLIYTLSTYMGHVKPEDTYWYLTATPELLDLACSKFEAECGIEVTPNE